jgi:hypothetical protein
MHLISEAICPYCDTRLDPVPKKKRECPHCGKTILVRTRPSDRERVLVTEEESEKIEEEWIKNRIIQRYKHDLESYGLDDREYLKIEKELAKKWGKAASAEDVIWAAYNKILQEVMKRNDFHKMSTIYYSQAWFLHDTDKDFFTVLQLAKKSELRYYQKTGVAKVKILAAPDSCDKCKSLNSTVWSIEEALDKSPIPVKECGNGFCRCCYGGIF